jgi:hypothetical protein
VVVKQDLHIAVHTHPDHSQLEAPMPQATLPTALQAVLMDKNAHVDVVVAITTADAV